MLVPKFSLKYGVLMMAMFMLSACQSMKSEQITTKNHEYQVIPDSAKDLFANYEQANSSKTLILKALNEHLNSERFVVSSYYYQMSPLYTKDSADKNSDGIWTSIFKVREYRKNQINADNEGFRSSQDYFPDKDEMPVDEPEKEIQTSDKSHLPYLRYDDEMAGNTPKTVSRLEAMSDDYIQVNEEIESLNAQVHVCAYEAINVVDYAVSDNPNINNKNKKIQQAQKKLNQCQTSVTKTANQILKKAQGYQIQDIHHLTGCLAEYKTGLAQMMKPNRNPKTLEDESLDNYDVLYYNFSRCREQFEITKILEPSVYTENAYTKKFLDTVSQIKQCSQSSIDRQKNLHKLGKNYTHNSDEFLQSHMDYAACAGTAVDGEEKTLETAADVRNRLYDVDAYIRNEGDDYLADYRKYSGLSGWLTAYREMKESETYKQSTKAELYDNFLKSMFASMLNYVKKTPEQITAQNIYQNNHMVTTQLWHHNPKEQLATGLLSLDFESPTAKHSMQLPIEFDFKQGAIYTDISALLPVMAAINPEHAPLPSEVADGQMVFKLPNTLAQKIPTDVIYDAINEGILAGFAEFNAQDFTKIDMTNDKFAKEVGATQVIKINLGSKEQGKILDMIAKKAASQLKKYVDDHPQFYPDTADDDKNGTAKTDKIKKAIDDFALLSSAHRANDVGGLAQMIEGILPFSLTQNSYLYLDEAGKLLAVQTFAALDDDIQDFSRQTVNQVRFDKAIFDAHPLAGKFNQSFDGKKPTFDGTAWLQEKIEEYRFQKQAELARIEGSDEKYEYEIHDFDEESISSETQK